MTTTVTTVSAAGPGTWIPLSPNENPYTVSLVCNITSGASLTYKVQYTSDSINTLRDASISRTTTTATVTLTAHGVRVGDSIIVMNCGAPFDGVFDVASITNANVFTYTVANSGASTSTFGGGMITLRCQDHSEIVSKTADFAGNFAFPVRACRINATGYVSGSVSLTVRQSA